MMLSGLLWLMVVVSDGLLFTDNNMGGEILCYQGSRSRVMAPTLLVLGCMKCGTSSLHNELIFRSQGRLVEGRASIPGRNHTAKEKHFFDTKRFASGEAGRELYFSYYPACRSGGGSATTGIDSSPSYIRDQPVPARVWSTYDRQASRLALVVTLRNPTSRMFSEFNHNRYAASRWEPTYANLRWERTDRSNATDSSGRSGGSGGGRVHPLAFSEWTTIQLRMAATIVQRYGSAALWPPALTKDFHSGMFHLHAGLYGRQLRNWLAAGFEAKQFIVLDFDGYANSSPQERREVEVSILNQAGLDIPAAQMPSDAIATPLAKFNSRSNQTEMEERTRQQLDGFYRSHNHELYSLLRENSGIRVLPAATAAAITTGTAAHRTAPGTPDGTPEPDAVTQPHGGFLDR